MILCPTSAFVRGRLSMLGRPTIDTKPARPGSPASRWCSRAASSRRARSALEGIEVGVLLVFQALEVLVLVVAGIGPGLVRGVVAGAGIDLRAGVSASVGSVGGDLARASPKALGPAMSSSPEGNRKVSCPVALWG